jgi:predicted RNA-binding Zn-ribbon protein involved in translation (DUF1610 family)
MTTWEPEWELGSVPDAELWSEVGRRRAARSHPKPKITAPCVHCGVLLGVAERRKPCPECGTRQPRVKVTRKRRKRKRQL